MTRVTHHDDDSSYVTVQQCRQNTQVKRWLLTILLGIMAIFLTMVGWAVTSANATAESTIEVKQALMVRQAKDDEVSKNITNAITDLKTEVTKLNRSVDDLKEKLWAQHTIKQAN
jgi:hypothetical protein